MRGKGRTAILKPKKEIERASESDVNVVGNYLAVLSEVCQSLCGQEFPHELGMTVLLKHGGMLAPSAAALLGERRMWNWIREYELAIYKILCETNIATVPHVLESCGSCVCSAELPFDIINYNERMSYYGRATITKHLACHLRRRISNVGTRWVKEGPWKVEDPTQGYRWSSRCTMIELWLRLWFNTSKLLELIPNDIQKLYHVNRGLRFRQGLSEQEFLYSANREQIREAIANANGTKLLRIEGDDYTSRAEWVRVFYNSLRPRPLKSWPHANA